VDGGAEREERSGGHDHRAARMSAAPEQHAGEQEYQPYDQPSDQARVRNHLRVLARNRALTPIFHSALRFAAFATFAQRASAAPRGWRSASGVRGGGVKPTPSSRSTVAGWLSALTDAAFSRASTSRGTPAGANRPNHALTSNPARPCSIAVGTSRSGVRSRV